MCNPVAGLMVASMAMQAYGSYQQSQAQSAQADYATEVAKRDQILNERAAVDAEVQGERQARLQEMETAREKSAARAGLSAGGFDVNFGSSLMRQSDIEAMGNIEAGAIRDDAAREAYGIRVQGVREQAGAQGTIASSRAGATSSLITGATQVAQSGISAYQSGVFSSSGKS